jgi:hypothetical protein
MELDHKTRIGSLWDLNGVTTRPLRGYVDPNVRPCLLTVVAAKGRA